MKIKNLLITFGLAGVLGLGVAAGLSFKMDAKEAKAASGDILSGYQLVGAGLGVGWNDAANNTYRFTEQSDGSYKWTGHVSVERFRVTKGDGTWTTMLNWNNVDAEKTCSGIFVKASTVTTDGDKNIWCTTAGDYNIMLNAAKNTISFSVAEAVVYQTVTKYAVLDGVKQDTTYGDPEQVVKGTDYAPGDATWSQYHFDGWFTDEGCTVAYVHAALNDDLTIYCKFTSISEITVDSYFYYVTDITDGSEDSDYNFYSFGGVSQFGAWPGTAITAIDGAQKVQGVVSFQGSFKVIYKIPFRSGCNDTHIILNNSAESIQSSDMLLVNKAAYWLTLETDYHNDDAGAALDFIIELEAIRNAVAESTGIKQYSICGISAANAATLCNKYNALSNGVRSYIDSSTTYTYKRTDASQNDNVSFYDIMEELGTIANVTLTGHSIRISNSNNSANNNVVMIVVISIAASMLLGASAFFFIRKRRVNR